MSGTLLATANGFEVQGRLDLSASASVASATTLDLTTLATGNIVPVTGTTPVEAITMPVGSMTIIPAAALPLVYNATTCKIIGGANYTCTAGVPVELVNDGSVVHVFPIGTAAVANIGVSAGNVQQVDQAITATTRAATTTLGTTLNHTLSDTSATITAFNGVAGVTYNVKFLGAGNITHGSGIDILQMKATITTKAGDTARVRMLTGTTCELFDYMHEGDVIDYSASSTIVGWSSFSNKYIVYKDIGKTRFVYFYIDGTSNSSDVSFTLPDNTATMVVSPILVSDGSVYRSTGALWVYVGTSTVLCYKEGMASWSASGWKEVGGTFSYQLP